MKQENYLKKNLINLAIYTALFLFILMPFYKYGFLEVFSVSLVLAFFAGMHNTMLSEYFEWKEAQSNGGIVNRVTGERYNPDHETRPPGQRDPNENFKMDNTIDFTKPLHLIPITERLPEVDQDVIVWTGQRLAAAKYVKRLVAISLDPYKVEEQGQWQVEKYHSSMDRSIVTSWSNVTHWMPANL